MPAITATTFLALFALLTVLSAQVSRLRIRHRVSFGDGGHKDLLQAIRAHGNTLEQSTLFVLLLLFNEWQQPAHGWLTLAGAAFVLARLLHAAAIFARRLKLRQAAHVLSVLLQLVLAAALGRALLAGASL